MSTSALSFRSFEDASPGLQRGDQKRHLAILSAVLLVLLAQLATKTSISFTLCSTSALLFGLYSVTAAGGIKTAVGFLNAVVTGKFLVIAFLLKLATLQAMDSHLSAPTSTGMVMALGFLGLLTGTWVHRRLAIPARPIVPEVSGARMYLSLTIVLFVVSYAGYFIGISPDLAGDGVQTGGFLGIARNFSLFKSIPVMTALYFAWARGGSRFMTHPLVLTVLTFSTLFGVFSTAKQDAMEPLLFYVAVSASRYGIFDKRLWLLGAGGIIYYSLIIYPYSQYVRSGGGRQGNLAERARVMGNVLWWQLTDPNFREYTKSRTEAKDDIYLAKPSLEPFSRLAMIGEADKLVAATDVKQHTGWETIRWGFALITPSFLYPNKPIVGTGNYLGHITGEASPDDDLTQFSYGLMANFYNAFSLPGVFIGSALFFCLFYYSFRLWFGDARWTPTPEGTTLWFLILVGFYQHSLVEESFAGMVSRMLLPFMVYVLYQLARAASVFLPLFPADEANVYQD